MTTTIFERQTCTRCGGSGQYSYNQIDGTRCFGCSGTGESLTKRGKAARQWYLNQLELKAIDVKEGMRIDLCGSKFTVASISEIKKNGARKNDDGSWTDTMGITFVSAQGNSYGCDVKMNVNIVPIGDDKNTRLLAAKAYQETLTKAGTPRK